MNKTEQLYEGKAKKVWATEDPTIVIVDYKDDATAFNGLKKGTIVGKGVVNNKMSNYLMQLLEKHGVPTHFVEELSDRETAVKKVTIVPLLKSPDDAREYPNSIRKIFLLPVKRKGYLFNRCKLSSI